MKKVIEVNNISKLYKLGVVGTGTFREDLQQTWWRLTGRNEMGFKDEYSKEIESDDYIWALRDVNFDVMQGDTLGVIGSNGAGKSTLLKIMSRTTAPTNGTVKIKGKIASLLEVGTGFHPELSGRQNIFLNGSILGMTRREIKSKFDEIVDFSGVEKYIDTPVKRYSSGMYVRLAFSVSAHLEPDILIVDEVLAVGDSDFRKKALGKMQNVSTSEGRTVIFVSHDMNAIIALCKKSLLLKNGAIQNFGNTDAVVQDYRSGSLKSNLNYSPQISPTTPHFSNISIELLGKQPNLSLQITCHLLLPQKAPGTKLYVSYFLSNSIGITIFQTTPKPQPLRDLEENKEYIINTIVNLPMLIPDIYFVSAWLGEHGNQTYDSQKDILSFEILESPQPGRVSPHVAANGFMLVNSQLELSVKEDKINTTINK